MDLLVAKYDHNVSLFKILQNGKTYNNFRTIDNYFS